jgi:hypothetical protein
MYPDISYKHTSILFNFLSNLKLVSSLFLCVLCVRTYFLKREKRQDTEKNYARNAHIKKKKPNYIQFWDQRLGPLSTFVSLIIAFDS